MVNRITFFISSLSGGGAEAVCVSLANGFAEHGWNVDLVLRRKNNIAYLNRVTIQVNVVDLEVNHARDSPLALLRYINKEKSLNIFF
jgi:hypothetical protein